MYIVLIDSDASRCYTSPKAVVEWELPGTPELVHLELADGSKICSTQKIRGVLCTARKMVCYEDFIVVKLLHGVDVVLRMTWLQRWNPLIDWVQQVMYIRLQNEWDHIRGLFLNKEHCIGTVKILTDTELASLPLAPNILILRTPQFWMYSASCISWKNVPNEGAQNETAQFCNSLDSPRVNSLHSSLATKKVTQYARVARIVQKKTSKKAVGQRQMLSPKHMQKLMKKGETCYLALVLPNKLIAV